jgi:hypothetical protein
MASDFPCTLLEARIMRTLSVVLLILIAGCGWADGFRGIEWGSSRAEVERIEGDDYEVDSSKGGFAMIYVRDVADCMAVVIYTLFSDKVVAGLILWAELSKEEEARIRKQILAKYGSRFEHSPDGSWVWFIGDINVALGTRNPFRDATSPPLGKELTLRVGNVRLWKNIAPQSVRPEF